MKLSRALFCLVAAAMLCSCTPPTKYSQDKTGAAAEPPVLRERTAYLKHTTSEPISCTNGADCSEKWTRALAWVTSHSSYSIKTSTDSEIVTSGPIEPTTDSAFTVTKTPAADGTSAINFTSSCGKADFCTPTTLELGAGFHNYVLNGQ